MKQKATTHDLQERKSKYIPGLIDEAKVRELKHEIVNERNIAKKRSKDDHLFEGKDKFVTGAYKRRLAEQSKWSEGERLRELQEENEDITKKGDMSEFYFNLAKNVAFGAITELGKKEQKQQMEESSRTFEEKIQTSDRSFPSTSTRSALVNAPRGDVSRRPVTESSSSPNEAASEPITEQT